MSKVSLALYEEAVFLQRRGYTLTEIAAMLAVSRITIVDVLYYDLVKRRSGQSLAIPRRD